MSQLPRIKVSENKRYLITEQGEPFFWLGDTAWELFHRSTREDAEYYLENRSRKGFSVIQAVVLAEMDGLHTPNVYGEIPLFNDDPTTPNDAYFQHVDFVVRTAARHGLYIGLLPTWADKVRPAWRTGVEVIFTDENAYAYGRFLGERYRNDSNIIWILGGDRTADGLEAFWQSMAKGIEDGTGFHPLMTFHPAGGYSSSEWLTAAPWLDFHMLQSGHDAKDNPNWAMLAHDYNLQPTRPILDGEPNYEDHPINWRPENGYFDDYDVRKQAYRGVFAGALGHTYGHQSVWQMYQEGREPVAAPLFFWREALDRPGASQLIHLRNLMLSRPFLTRIPDQSLILSDVGERADHIQATRAADGSYAFVFIPKAGQSVTLNLSTLSGTTLRAWWYDPRTGAVTALGEHEKSAQQLFTTPVEGPDWVLVLDDAARGWAEPVHIG